MDWLPKYDNPLDFVGTFLLIFGVFLVLAGFGVVSIEKVSVKKSPVTWILGAIVFVIGLWFLAPHMTENPVLPTATPDAPSPTLAQVVSVLPSPPSLLPSPAMQFTPVPSLTAAGVNASLPTMDLLSQLPSLFSLTSYKGLMKPGKNTYSIIVQSDQSYYLGFPWCTSTEEQLNSNLPVFNYQLFIDNQEVPDNDILEYEAPVAKNGYSLYCHYWTTILENWRKNTTVIIDAIFVHSASVFDGMTSYLPGKYEQLVVVKGKLDKAKLNGITLRQKCLLK